ncbi:unnamed protein product [Closterium sp. NIES-64]|nr:unnamed protein product [Closterium sp. NIES-64]
MARTKQGVSKINKAAAAAGRGRGGARGKDIANGGEKKQIGMTSLELRQLKVASAEFHREQILEAVGGGKKVEDDNAEDYDDLEEEGMEDTEGDGGRELKRGGGVEMGRVRRQQAVEVGGGKGAAGGKEVGEGEGGGMVVPVFEGEGRFGGKTLPRMVLPPHPCTLMPHHPSPRTHMQGQHINHWIIWLRKFHGGEVGQNDHFPEGGYGVDDEVPDGGVEWVGADTWPAPPTEGVPARKGQQLITQTYPKCFDKDYLQQAMCEWVVATDQAFTVVEHPTFRNMMAAANPECAVERVIPSRSTLARQIIRLAGLARITLMEMLAADGVGAVVLTHDIWTGENHQSYISVTGHCVNEKFELMQITLDFLAMPGKQNSARIIEVLLDVVKEWKLEKRCIAVTSDNASSQRWSSFAVGGQPAVSRPCSSPGCTSAIPCRELAAEGSKYPTISRVVPQFNELLDGLDTLKNTVSSPPSGVMKDCITKAEEKLMEYYSGSSDELWVATILDPSFKIGYFEMDGEGGDKESERPGGVQHVAVERALALVRAKLVPYKAKAVAAREKRERAEGGGRGARGRGGGNSSGGSSSGRGGGAGRKGGAAGGRPTIDSFGGVDGDRRSLRARLEEYRSRQEESVRDEVQIYIDERLEPLGTCPLSYWRRRNDLEGLQAMALDYLAIPATSAASERNFSRGRNLITWQRHSLGPERIRACMILKSWVDLNTRCKLGKAAAKLLELAEADAVGVEMDEEQPK